MPLLPRLRRVFAGWEKDIARPIFVSVLSAVILLVISLLFDPIRHFLLPPEAGGYPLLCIAEPYGGFEAKRLFVDFFVFNRSDKESFTLEDLETKLGGAPGGKYLTSTITLPLKGSARGARVVSARQDDGFNDSKGDLHVDLDANGTVTIKVLRIGERALLKAIIEVSDMPGLGHGTVYRRQYRGEIPFQYEDYMSGCYGRK